MASAHNGPIQVLEVTNSGTKINEGTDDEQFIKIGVRCHLTNGTSVVWNTQRCKELDDLGVPTGNKVVRDSFRYHNENAGGTLTRKAASMTRSAFRRLHPNFADQVIAACEQFVIEQIAKREAKKMANAAKKANKKG